MKTAKLILGIAITMFAVAGAQPFAAGAMDTNVTVEIIIFSGRRNPTWQLQDTKPLEKLKSKMKELPEAFTNEPPHWSTLGFKGFYVCNAEKFGLPSQFRIYEGVVNSEHGKNAKYLKDLTRLEQSLIDESKKQPLEPAVRNAIADYERARKAEQ